MTNLKKINLLSVGFGLIAALTLLAIENWIIFRAIDMLIEDPVKAIVFTAIATWIIVGSFCLIAILVILGFMKPYSR